MDPYSNVIIQHLGIISINPVKNSRGVKTKDGMAPEHSVSVVSR